MGALDHLSYHSHPQTAQDRWVTELFKGKTGGFFVEAGASNGTDFSNTYVLERDLGWQGICIEANDDFFAELVKHRQRCEHACLYSEETELDFVMSDYCSGIDKHIYDWHRKETRDGVIVKKECTTLESVLDKHSAPDVIDYVSLDTEGSEHEILKNFPFDKYAVSALSIECAFHCEDLLASKGFVEVKNRFAEVEWETFFIHSSMNR